MKKRKGFLIVITVLAAVAVLVGGGRVNAQAVSQSYGNGSSTSLSPGMIVQLDPKDSANVIPATQSNVSRTFGVVVSPNSTPVTLSNDASKQQVYVATTGNYNVLVSDEGGAIHVGDYVTVSPVAGVGMKAGTTQNAVLGKALNNFDGSSNVIGTTPISEKGHSVTAHLGYVSINLSLSHNPLYQTSKPAQVNSFLLKFGQSVADRTITTQRVYISLAILFTCIVLAGGLLYAGVRSSVAALGRNPLARRAITRSLIQIILASLSIFLIGLLVVYAILKL